MKSTRVCLYFLLAALLVAAGAAAQTATSRITGLVTDQSGAVVAGANVTLTNEATGVTYKTVSTDAGTYLFDALPSGNYTVQVEFQGFRTFRSRNNVLSVGVPLTVNARFFRLRKP